MKENDFQATHVALLENSYKKLLHKSLIAENYGSKSFAQALFEAPFVVVSHGTEVDPVFNYLIAKRLNFLA